MKNYKITKKSALKLTKDILGLVCKITSYESPDNIEITVVDTDPEAFNSIVYREHRYMTSMIVINIKDASTYDELVEVISHEIAHVMLDEYLEAYSTWNDTDEESRKKPKYRSFTRAEERSAMRIGRIIQNLWNQGSNKK